MDIIRATMTAVVYFRVLISLTLAAMLRLRHSL